jgi:hypothetical protein
MIKKMIQIGCELSQVQIPPEYFELPEVKRAVAGRVAQELRI